MNGGNMFKTAPTQDPAENGTKTSPDVSGDESALATECLGKKIQEIRLQKGWTLEVLAEHSHLDIDKLRSIEGKEIPPSVFDLQRLAKAMDVPIADFFDSIEFQKPIVFTSRDKRPEAKCCQAMIQNLGRGIRHSTLEPFVVTMPENATSGGRNLIHGGFEFAYCLSGKILYWINEVEYQLSTGDSILFSASTPHRWENDNTGESQFILVLTSVELHDKQGKLHFTQD
jgi:transcriptional regulator with XRE-family HTH domain